MKANKKSPPYFCDRQSREAPPPLYTRKTRFRVTLEVHLFRIREMKYNSENTVI